MDNQTTVVFAVKLNDNNIIELFKVKLKSYDASVIDDIFASEMSQKSLHQINEIEELIMNKGASIWAIEVDGTRKTLLASQDYEHSTDKNIYWKGRRSTLEKVFGIESFKYDH